MSTLTDTASAVAEAAKVRDDAFRALDVEYNEASKDAGNALNEASQVARNLDNAYSLTRKAIREDYRDAVAELTGTDPQDEDNPW